MKADKCRADGSARALQQRIDDRADAELTSVMKLKSYQLSCSRIKPCHIADQNDYDTNIRGPGWVSYWRCILSAPTVDRQEMDVIAGPSSASLWLA